MNMILFICLSIILLVLVEVLKRRSYISNDLSRRLAHIGAGVINIVAPLCVSQVAIIGVNIIFAGMLIAGRYTHYFSSIQVTTRKTYGDIYFPLGIVLAAVVLLPGSITAFQYGVAIMGISDALAGFVGESWGKRTMMIFNNKKTLLGSLVFFFTSLVITLIFAPQLLFAVLILPLLLTAVELVLAYGLDNLVLPIVAGLLFQKFFLESTSFVVLILQSLSAAFC